MSIDLQSSWLYPVVWKNRVEFDVVLDGQILVQVHALLNKKNPEHERLVNDRGVFKDDFGVPRISGFEKGVEKFKCELCEYCSRHKGKVFINWDLEFFQQYSKTIGLFCAYGAVANPKTVNELAKVLWEPSDPYLIEGNRDHIPGMHFDLRRMKRANEKFL